MSRGKKLSFPPFPHASHHKGKRRNKWIFKILAQFFPFFHLNFSFYIFQVRCLSHTDFSLTLQSAEKLFDEGSCSRRKMHSCDCPTCKTSAKLFRNYELESPNDTLIKVRKTGSKSMKFDYESVKQSESKSEKEELIESVNNQVVGKPEIKAADTGRCSTTYILFLVSSHLILLNL